MPPAVPPYNDAMSVLVLIGHDGCIYDMALQSFVKRESVWSV